MDTQKSQEQFQQYIDEWRNRFEDLKVQFALGKMNASDLFEKYKDYYRLWLFEFKEGFMNSTDSVKADTEQFRAKIDELLLQLNLGKAEGKEMFDEQKTKIEHALNELYSESKNIFGNQYDQILKVYDTQSQSFKTSLEILRLQFMLGKMESKYESEKLRGELNEKLNELNLQFTKFHQTGKEFMDEWNKLLLDNYNKLKVFSETWFKNSGK